MLAVNDDVEGGHALSGARLDPLGVLFGVGEPLLGAFLARVPFDDVAHGQRVGMLLVVRFDHGDVVDGIVTAVQTQQQTPLGQASCPNEHPREQLGCAFLAMLAALAHLQLQAPTLLAEVGGHRRKAIVALVGARDAFLVGLAVVEGGHVAVERDQAVVQRRDWRTDVAYKRHRCVLGDGTEGIGVGVHALAQRAFGRHLLEAERFVEELILAKAVDRLEIALAQTQHRDIGRKHVAMAYGIATQRCNRSGIRRQSGITFQCHANESQAGMRGEIRLGFRDDELTQHVTCEVSLKMRLFYRYPPVLKSCFTEKSAILFTDTGFKKENGKHDEIDSQALKFDKRNDSKEKSHETKHSTTIYCNNLVICCSSTGIC